MPRLIPANDEQLQAVFRESHLLWGAGLSPRDYRELWYDLRATVWAAKHAAFYVWIDRRGRILSSVKIYRPLLRLHDTTSRTTVLSAVFTPRAARGQGHAKAMVLELLARAREQGTRTAFLFSDIGSGFYADFGFRALPAIEQAATIRPAALPAGWSVRPMERSDMDRIRRAHECSSVRRPICVVRDAEQWEFLRLRSASFFERLREPGIRHSFLVVRYRSRFAGYLITLEGRGEWHVREVGAADGRPESMAALLCVAASEAFAGERRKFRAWLPPDVVGHLNDWRVRTRTRRKAVPMLAALQDGDEIGGLSTAQAAYVPFQDQF